MYSKYSNIVSGAIANPYHFLKGLAKSCPKIANHKKRKLELITNVEQNRYCRKIKEFRLSRTDLINLNEEKCTKGLNMLMSKALLESIDSFTIKGFSENCEPKEMIITGYCCQK